jgi:hypothetical protein
MMPAHAVVPQAPLVCQRPITVVDPVTWRIRAAPDTKMLRISYILRVNFQCFEYTGELPGQDACAGVSRPGWPARHGGRRLQRQAGFQQGECLVDTPERILEAVPLRPAIPGHRDRHDHAHDRAGDRANS